MSLPSGLPAFVEDAEVVARHVFTKSHIGPDPEYPTRKWVRPAAFLPLRDHEGDWVFSVSRLKGLMDVEDIQRNGIAVGQVSGRSYKASARMIVKAVRQVAMLDGDGQAIRQLDVVGHEPPPLHAHVSGYLPLPEHSNPKEYFKEAAEMLAKAARKQPIILRTLTEELG